MCVLVTQDAASLTERLLLVGFGDSLAYLDVAEEIAQGVDGSPSGHISELCEVKVR